MFRHVLILLIVAITVTWVHAQPVCNTSTVVQLPGDLRLGACNGSTVCQQLNACVNVSCPTPSGCNIQQCINGICKVTGEIDNCCITNSDCDDGNVCTIDTCVTGFCQYSPGGGNCQRDFDCAGNNICTGCLCVPAPNINITGFCFMNSQCVNGPVCTTGVCQPDNTCGYIPIAGCCTTNSNCQANVSACFRTSQCNTTSQRCIAQPTDQDHDGIPCPFDCNDTNASIGAPTQVYIDTDGDGVGSSLSVMACTLAGGFSNITGDCDDANICIYPGNNELCWDVWDNQCNPVNSTTMTTVLQTTNCVDPWNNCVFFDHPSLNDTGPDGYNGSERITLKAYHRFDITDNSTKLNVIQEMEDNFSELRLYSRDILSASVPARIDLLVDSLFTNGTLIGVTQSINTFTAEAITLMGGDYIVVYGWAANVTNPFVIINMANLTDFTSPVTFTIASAAPANISAYGIFGAPSIAQNSGGVVFVAYQLQFFNAILLKTEFAVVVIHNTSSDLSTTTWISQVIFSNSFSEPTPKIRSIHGGIAIACVFGYDPPLPPATTSVFQYLVSTTGNGTGTYAVKNVTFPGLGTLKGFQIDLIPLFDGTPLMIGLTSSNPERPSYATACTPGKPSNALSAAWNCFQIEEATGIAVTLMQNNPFLSYWATDYSFQENNGNYTFSIPSYKLHYATSCTPIPSAGSWQVFGLPQSATFPAHSLGNFTSVFSSYPHYTAILPTPLNNDLTLAILDTNVVGLEICQ